VVYQPQFACADNRLTGAEALARWNHPLLGRIGAGALFAIAERADHVPQLSQAIARQALAGARGWPMDMRLSLNITPNDLAVSDFADQFSALLAETGFPAWRLTLEVTEQVLLADVSHAAQALGQLAAQGMRIALDDFGTGYSSLSQLAQLPIDKLKVDRAFVTHIDSDARSLAIAEAVLTLGQKLGVEVVAEGIETPAAMTLLRDRGCGLGQGYLIGAPMRAQQLREWQRAREAMLSAAVPA